MNPDRDTIAHACKTDSHLTRVEINKATGRSSSPINGHDRLIMASSRAAFGRGSMKWCCECKTQSGLLESGSNMDGGESSMGQREKMGRWPLSCRFAMEVYSFPSYDKRSIINYVNYNRTIWSITRTRDDYIFGLAYLKMNLRSFENFSYKWNMEMKIRILRKIS